LVPVFFSSFALFLSLSYQSPFFHPFPTVTSVYALTTNQIPDTCLRTLLDRLPRLALPFVSTCAFASHNKT
jgi:hypothetical protein